MRTPIRALALLSALALLLSAPSARAQALRLVSADARGVTLRLDLPEWRLVDDPVTRRMNIMLSGLESDGVPGRPALPAASALVAVPQGARVSAAIIAQGDEEVRENVTLVITGKPGWQRDDGGLGVQPTVEEAPAILDGVWPRSPLEVGAPFGVRHQRMVAVRVSPFRYDEATGRLWAKKSVTVRVSFSGGSSGAALLAPLAADTRTDAVLAQALINPEQAKGFRDGLRPARAARLGLAPRAGARGADAFGFDEDNAEVRVRIDSTAVFAIGYDDLAANGYPGAVPIAAVSVHRHEFVEHASPPYVTVEVPCEVIDGNANGVFDSGDAVMVYAQTWLERARPGQWQRWWGDADFLYVTHLTGRSGLRMTSRPGWRGATGLTPLASYPMTIHYEHDGGDQGEYYAVLPDTLTDPFHWVPLLNYYDRPDSFTFTATDLDTSRRARIDIQWVGRLLLDQRITGAQVRNGAGVLTAVVDSARWGGKTTLTLGNTLSGSALTEGLNSIRFWARRSDLAPDPVGNPPIQTALNWYEVTHWRAYRAIKGYLACTSADAADLYQVKAGGFSSNGMEVWDVTDSTAAVRLDLDPSHVVQSAGRWSVEFQDSTAAGQPRRYVVWDQPRFAPPEAFAPVTRRHLTESASAHDYLLVVPSAWVASVAKLVAARQAQGLDVLVAPYEAVCDEFNGGRPSAHAVRRLIQYAYDNWDVRYVTLMGDAGGPDPVRRYATASREWVPTFMIRGPVGALIGSEFGLETIPSDSWYGWCLNPSCQADPSLAPRTHDVFVGRLPVNSAAEAAAVSAKLAAYDTITVDQTWRREMTLLADDQFSGGLLGDFTNPTYCRQPDEIAFYQLSWRMRDIILNDAGLAQSNPTVFDMAQELAGEDTVMVSGRACRPSPSDVQLHTRAGVTPKLLTQLSSGKLWWDYHGHANELLLAHEHIWYTQGSADDWRLLANDMKPFLFSAFSCHANNFTKPSELSGNIGPCVGEELVTAPRTGAVASWASTGFELIPTGGPTGNHISLEFTRALFSSVPPDTSLPLRAAGDPYAHPVLGDAVALALLRWGGTNPFRQEGLSYELLGDPATRMSIGQPQTFVTANGAAVTSGVPVRLHTLADTVRIVADLVSNTALMKLQVERDIAGVRDTVPASDYTITPAFPDTALGGLGGRRYRITYRTSLTPRSTTFTFRAVDRQNVPSSFDVAIPFQSVLRAEGLPVNNGDVLAPSVNLTLLVLSPAPIADPANALVLRINGVTQAFTATPNVGDVSGREWVVSWTHAPFPIGDYAVELLVDGVASAAHSFKVTITSNELRLANAMLFPNPFEDDLGAFFSFDLESGRPADVLIRVYTPTGRLIYRQLERQLAPGYHQLPWDGRDAEGDKLANGVYFYRLQASNGPSDVTVEGRMVKLRRPRHEEPVTP